MERADCRYLCPCVLSEFELDQKWSCIKRGMQDLPIPIVLPAGIQKQKNESTTQITEHIRKTPLAFRSFDATVDAPQHASKVGNRRIQAEVDDLGSFVGIAGKDPLGLVGTRY